MPGVSYVPANGRQTPLRGVIWVPSAVRVKFGFGRRNAVISCAFDSSMPICPARSVGFAASNLSRISCHVNGFCAKALPASIVLTENAKHKRLHDHLMNPPHAPLDSLDHRAHNTRSFT